LRGGAVLRQQPDLSLFGRAIINGILLDQSPVEEDSSVHEE
jgi:hypothetical protein